MIRNFSSIYRHELTDGFFFYSRVARLVLMHGQFLASHLHPHLNFAPLSLSRGPVHRFAGSLYGFHSQALLDVPPHSLARRPGRSDVDDCVPESLRRQAHSVQ